MQTSNRIPDSQTWGKSNVFIPRDCPPICVVLLIALSFALTFRAFFPTLTDIWSFDEANYLNNGRLLLQGELPTYAFNPLVAAFWALAIIPFQESPFWLMHAYTLGRIVIFIFLWYGVYVISRQLKHIISPIMPLLLLLVTPSLLSILDNSSDALFAVLSAFALWQFLRFSATGLRKHLVICSVFIAMAALCRNDGLILFITALILVILLHGARTKTIRSVAVFMAPFAVIVGGYVALAGLLSGELEVGTKRRLYDAFEQGQGVACGSLYEAENPYVEGYAFARDLYGTPEDNNYSVVKAIQRNPRAFLQRITQVIIQMPAQAFVAYGKGFRGIGALLLLLAVRGIVALAGKRAWSVLLILLAWPLHMLAYLVTFFREGYFLLPCAIVFVLAAIGSAPLFSTMNQRRERVIACAVLLGLIIYALGAVNKHLLASGVVFLLGLSVIWILSDRYGNTLKHSVRTSIGCYGIVFLLAIQSQFCRPARCSIPSIPELGTAPDEQAALFLAGYLPAGSNVATYSPAPVIMARLGYIPMFPEPRKLTSRSNLLWWLMTRDVKAIYIDELFRQCEPGVCGRLDVMKGEELEVVYQDDQNDIQVLLLRPELP